MKLPIYLDYNATTPVDPRVFAAMAPYFTDVFGNAASRTHCFGRAAESAVIMGATRWPPSSTPNRMKSTARERSSGQASATEANNLAIKGVVEACHEKGRHIITQTTEHKAVLDPYKRLASQGNDITVLPVDQGGACRPGRLPRRFGPTRFWSRSCMPTTKRA